MEEQSKQSNLHQHDPLELLQRLVNALQFFQHKLHSLLIAALALLQTVELLQKYNTLRRVEN